ncbi:class I adenylate-forming enzyme family protein [Spirillospora sp. NPDC029432]|uniref:class I adenylate-forming enzyme family protein n=1 Tax=Spirillospora sp. NPDC029432 TaxID=3154599 RepID=UPI0034512389
MIVDPRTTARYTAAGWWSDRTLGDRVRDHARRRPDTPAYIEPGRVTTWAEYDARADTVAAALAGLAAPGERVALLLPDTADFHIALLATERAGLVAVGIGSRAGDAEIAHLVARTGARTIVTLPEHRDRDMTGLAAALRAHGAEPSRHLLLGDDLRLLDVSGTAPAERPITPEDPAGRALGPNDLWLLNSTSGTTGLPKCVTQFQNRWVHFSRLAVQAGDLGPDDVFFGAVPAPFGFGLWTAHVAPTLLGVPTVVLPRFDANTMARMIERERATVLCAVSTQFRMLLRSTAARCADLSSLRAMFTGGEAIGYDSAAEFEERTGAVVLNFFGSNESGAFSHTRHDDTRERRLRTGGRVIPEMDVRLYDDEGNDVTATGGPGRPGGLGPLLSAGYYDDDAANEQLYTPDGHLLMGDLVTIDADGYLHLVGRTSDIIIRGGKNISAVQVEEAVAAHPAVELAAVVAVPDELFGERVCAVVTTREKRPLTLPELVDHLVANGMSKELLPEHLLVVDELPQSSGGKLAKGEIRALAASHLASG